MTEYINIHTHKPQHKENIEIINIFPQNDAAKIINDNPDSLFSIGLHPWYINDNFNAQLQIVEQLSTLKNVVAIGETGLDKLTETDFTKQTTVFKAQIQIAEKIKKPLIIHCVKAYQEVLAIKKELNPRTGFIFHGFRGKPELAQQLLKHGCYISLGSKAESVPETVKIIPLDKLFIETDEVDTDVKEIYESIAKIKNIDVTQLVQSIRKNYDEVFNVSSI